MLYQHCAVIKIFPVIIFKTEFHTDDMPAFFSTHHYSTASLVRQSVFHMYKGIKHQKHK